MLEAADPRAAIGGKNNRNDAEQDRVPYGTLFAGLPKHLRFGGNAF
ncbi:MAG TPA: hypothetical protein VFR09_09040 [Alphaproteobacteria bacterium]|nr:hypothetical protein [Alphaproteobacteria bacterium]